MLTQAQADLLMRMPKRMVNVGILVLPPAGAKYVWQANSLDGREEFLIDYRQGSICLTKITVQERYQTTEILLRLDLDGPPHTNPDSTTVPTPHLHVYREGYGDKWAYPVPSEIDLSSGNRVDILVSFLRYCGVNPVPPRAGRCGAVTYPQELVDAYVQWLKQNITVKDINGWIELTTPFLDRHNDHLQIYVKILGDEIILTDDGYILSDLEMSGCDVATPRRRELLETTLAGFGVELQDGSLTARATRASFPQKKHALVQAMLAVNDLFMTSRSTVRSLFIEDVEQFLVSYQIRYVASVQITGRSGLAHRFDYVIAGWHEVPERLVEAINHPTRERVTSLLFAWNDIRAVRKRNMAMYAIMNDSDRHIPKALVDACTDYGVRAVPWSEREQIVEELRR